MNYDLNSVLDRYAHNHKVEEFHWRRIKKRAKKRNISNINIFKFLYEVEVVFLPFGQTLQPKTRELLIKVLHRAYEQAINNNCQDDDFVFLRMYIDDVRKNPGAVPPKVVEFVHYFSRQSKESLEENRKNREAAIRMLVENHEEKADESDIEENENETVQARLDSIGDLCHKRIWNGKELSRRYLTVLLSKRGRVLFDQAVRDDLWKYRTVPEYKDVTTYSATTCNNWITGKHNPKGFSLYILREIFGNFGTNVKSANKHKYLTESTTIKEKVIDSVQVSVADIPHIAGMGKTTTLVPVPDIVVEEQKEQIAVSEFHGHLIQEIASRQNMTSTKMLEFLIEQTFLSDLPDSILQTLKIVSCKTASQVVADYYQNQNIQNGKEENSAENKA